MKKLLLSFIFLCLLDALALAFVYFSLPETKGLLGQQKIERRSLDGSKKSFVIDPKSSKYVSLRRIPEHLQRSVIFLEDARFYEHYGFDFYEIKTAISEGFREGGNLRGASSISQQLVKNLYLSADRTWWRKFLEALITIKLELQVPKYKIFEVYLNIIDWGQGVIGIRAASEHYFGKTPEQLDFEESAFLAAIIPNPARFGKNPDSLFVRRQSLRAKQLLYRNGYISIEDFKDSISPNDEESAEQEASDETLDSEL